MTNLLRRRDVEQRTGLSRTAIYMLAKAGKFPAPIKLTERASAWVEADVSAWITARVEGRVWSATAKPIETHPTIA